MLVPRRASWKYLDNGSNQGTAWRERAFDDTTWRSGPAELGYGDGDEATVVGYGPNASDKYITTYFRHAFEVADPSAFTFLRLSVLRDDGAVVYLNGTEAFRTNMPSGTIGHRTLAAALVGGTDERTFYGTDVDPRRLVAGRNVLAVEVHQVSADSSDLSFDLELTASDTVSVTRGPYLQLGTSTGAVVRWRTNAPTTSRVRYGTSAGALNAMAENTTATTEHEVTLSGLQPDTRYFYSVGDASGALAGGDANHFFVTAPAPGTARPIRVWVLGDSGTANTNAAQVRNAYQGLTGSRYTDVWLMLGDNAYPSGTDEQYQRAVFDMYPAFLRQSFLWPTIGNHDTAQSSNPPGTLPYFAMFTLPTMGQVGGVASGTEKYYSFDYGNIHFVCLDSMSSSRASNGAMVTWLKQDLAANTRDWLIAYFHHPPYTKGSHDSDAEIELREMRENVIPVLEQHGVDLVLAGHSHVYERSFLIDGHYGTSSTFTEAMKKDGGSGRPTQGGAYAKPTAGPGPREGAVYVVAGSSGQITGGSPALNHPAMFISLNRLGSVVLDVDGRRLDHRFVRETGAIDDSFTIVKGPQTNALPTVSITQPAANATFVAPASVTIRADASDTDGTVVSVAFYQGSTLLATDGAAPWEHTWSGAPAGTYQLTARATDDKGATTTSSPVTITVNPPAPPAPSGLAASAVSTTQIDLTWTDNATTEQGFKVERSLDGSSFTTIATPPANTTSHSAIGLMADTTYHFRVRAYNAGGDSAPSNTASARTRAASACVPELCDGQDNDCDMTVDEDFPDKGMACAVGLGECARTGTRICAPNGMGTVCSASPGMPEPELCDGKDNDCQGDVDEDFSDKGAPCSVGTGECLRTGVRVCSPSKSGTVCSATPGPPAIELCDGKDNDCDDLVDEEFPDRGAPCSLGIGECARTGTRVCAPNGMGTVCGVTAAPPTAELCDGKDNDCDGMVDEDFPDKGAPCSAGAGECARMGTRVCAPAGRGTTCSATPGAPGVEICGDGKDNDCDGMIDEGCAPDAAPDSAPAGRDAAPDRPAESAPDAAPRAGDGGGPADGPAPPGPRPESPDAAPPPGPGDPDAARGPDRDGSADAPGTLAAVDGGVLLATSSGCSCRVGDGAGRPPGGTAAALSLLLALLARRRRRP